MKDANLWDFDERRYFKTQIPDGCKTFAIDMDEEVICPDCFETLKYGDGITSLRWRGSGGIGYTVCEKCYEMEKKLARLANSRNARGKRVLTINETENDAAEEAAKPTRSIFDDLEEE